MANVCGAKKTGWSGLVRLVNYQSQLSDVIGSANLPSSRARAHLRRLGNRDESPHLGRAVLRILRDLDLPFRAYRISAGMLQLATSHRYLIYIKGQQMCFSHEVSGRKRQRLTIAEHSNDYLSPVSSNSISAQRRTTDGVN
jgi:hypothetical protein